MELGAQREALERAVAKTKADLDSIKKELANLSVALDELRARQTTANAVRDRLTNHVDRIKQERDWRQSQTRRTRADQDAMRKQQDHLTNEIAQITRSQEILITEIDRVEALLETLPTEALADELTAAQMALGAAQQARQAQQQALDGLESDLSRLEQERNSREHRVSNLKDEEKNVAEQVTQFVQDQTDVVTQLEDLRTKIEPSEERLAELEKNQGRLETLERVEHTRLREFENRLTNARIEVQRREDELTQLRSRIEEDLGLVELELGGGVSGQTPLPLSPVVSKLPILRELPSGVEEEIKRLRLQLRRMGAINPNAPEEYSETLERHSFLQEQSSDLIEASEALRKVIAEMDGLIEHAFRQTFEAVASEFSRNFGSLFGGGQARLELTDPEDLPQTGVDIVAQPPGKRLQTLASLSGGERALTAVALIFSILKVSPPPFCFLDEVDAMLDEANISRFRSMLEALTEHTQIVVITHNRGTVSAADTVYGVSMGADSVSQVYSIRLEGEKVTEA
jgi:chromosome segregation protein